MTTAKGIPLQQVTTDSFGRFHFQPVSAGTYIVSILAERGFDEQHIEVQITTAPFIPLRISLTLQSVRQRVEVTTEENSTSIDPTENRDQLSASETLLENVPVLDQNYIAALSPFLDQGGVSTGGVTIVVDGVEMKGTGVSASAIKGVKINNDPYSVESNRPGKGRIEIITKAGTPQFHGTVNFSFRDSATDAKNTFALSRPAEQRRIYDGSITGPLSRSGKVTFLISGRRQEDDLQAVVRAYSTTGTIFMNVPTPLRDTVFALRVAKEFGDTHRASLQYNVQDTITNNQGVGGLVLAQAGTDAQAREDDIVFSYSFTFSPHLVNQLQILLEKDHNPTKSAFIGQKTVVDGAFTGGGAQADRLETENNMKINEIVSWNKGKHLVKAGINIPNLSRRAWEDHANHLGTYKYASLADYVAQRPYSFTVQQGIGRTVFWYDELGIFIQDQVQLHPNLQMSYGLRYDWQTYFESPHDFAPRLSLAYALGKDHKTIVRTGGGLFYDRSGTAPILDMSRYNGVVLRSFTLLNPGFPNPLPLGQDFANYPTDLVVRAPDIHLPYSAHYSIGLERQVSKGSTLAITYRGNVGIDLLRSRDINAPFGPGYLARPNLNLGMVRQIEARGRQISNALDITFQKQAGRWFTGLSQYTWSHTNNDTGGVAWFPANQHDLSGEYSRANLDQRHRLNVLGTINEGHWLSLGISASLYSGTPYTETSGVDAFGTGILNARPPGIARNTLQSGGYADLDLRWSHEFLLKKALKDASPSFIVAVDAFNVPNRTNYSGYVGNVQSSFFLQPTTALPARRLQFTGRFKF